MTNDRFEERLREAAQDYHRPPATPREELWRRIAAARAARQARVIALRPALRWGVGIAAELALGVAIGRWSTTSSQATSVVAGTGKRPSTFVYPLAAAQYLAAAQALVTGRRSR